MNLLMSFLLDLWCVLSNPIQSSFSCEMAKVCKAIFLTRDLAKLYVNSDTLFHKSIGHEQLIRSGHQIVTVVSASEFRAALDQVINEHYFKLQVCAQAGIRGVETLQTSQKDGRMNDARLKSSPSWRKFGMQVARFWFQTRYVEFTVQLQDLALRKHSLNTIMQRQAGMYIKERVSVWWFVRQKWEKRRSSPQSATFTSID